MLKEDQVCKANSANAMSDESANNCGVEQLSIVIRFLDKQSNPSKMRKEFFIFLSL